MVDINDRRGARPLYSSVDEIKAAHKGHWFSPETTKFFKSRVGNTVIGGTHFVSSEQPPGGDRRYSVRAADADGGISTVGEFGAHATRREALKAAKQDVADKIVQKHPLDSYVRGQ